MSNPEKITSRLIRWVIKLVLGMEYNELEAKTEAVYPTEWPYPMLDDGQ